MQESGTMRQHDGEEREDMSLLDIGFISRIRQQIRGLQTHGITSRHRDYRLKRMAYRLEDLLWDIRHDKPVMH